MLTWAADDPPLLGAKLSVDSRSIPVGAAWVADDPCRLLLTACASPCHARAEHSIGAHVNRSFLLTSAADPCNARPTLAIVVDLGPVAMSRARALAPGRPLGPATSSRAPRARVTRGQLPELGAAPPRPSPRGRPRAPPHLAPDPPPPWPAPAPPGRARRPRGTPRPSRPLRGRQRGTEAASRGQRLPYSLRSGRAARGAPRSAERYSGTTNRKHSTAAGRPARARALAYVRASARARGHAGQILCIRCRGRNSVVVT